LKTYSLTSLVTLIRWPSFVIVGPQDIMTRALMPPRIGPSYPGYKLRNTLSFSLNFVANAEDFAESFKKFGPINSSKTWSVGEQSFSLW
jgi:hypothetical protein